MTREHAASDRPARLDRRGLIKLTGVGVAIAAASLGRNAEAQSQAATSTGDKCFPRSERGDHRKVTGKNRDGFTLSGDLSTAVGFQAIGAE
ncbi:hypothetical protein BH10PSE8_BH10PSE8_05050 [soil metagenome]